MNNIFYKKFIPRFFLASLWFGFCDIKNRYIRSFLGPLWITIATSIMLLAMGPIYSQIFGSILSDYYPFLCVGYVGWLFISQSISELSNSLVNSEDLIKQFPLPMHFYYLRALIRNNIVLLHNFIIILIVLIYTGDYKNFNPIYFAIALILINIFLYYIGSILSIICLRFRDVPQLVACILQILFFITPILWSPANILTHRYILYLNPMYYVIEVFRIGIGVGNIEYFPFLVLGIFIFILFFIFRIVYYFSNNDIPYWA